MRRAGWHVQCNVKLSAPSLFGDSINYQASSDCKKVQTFAWPIHSGKQIIFTNAKVLVHITGHFDKVNVCRIRYSIRIIICTIMESNTNHRFQLCNYLYHKNVDHLSNAIVMKYIFDSCRMHIFVGKFKRISKL